QRAAGAAEETGGVTMSWCARNADRARTGRGIRDDAALAPRAAPRQAGAAMLLDDLLRARLPAVGDWHSTPLRRAAVLCPLVLHRGEDHLLLVVRPADQRQHAGQI